MSNVVAVEGSAMPTVRQKKECQEKNRKVGFFPLIKCILQ